MSPHERLSRSASCVDPSEGGRAPRDPLNAFRTRRSATTTALLVPPQRYTVEPLVHPPKAVEPARIGRKGVGTAPRPRRRPSRRAHPRHL
jgi:hypothetical protein